MRPFAAVLFGLSLCFAFSARADERPGEPDHVHKAHAIAMHGEPKYGPDFTHFDYVNPNAPKGGTLRRSARGTFDSFNAYIPKGVPGAGSTNETLLKHSADEPFTLYGLIAESVEWPEDRSWVIFTLRPEARWHDGQAITVEDVIWSFETLRTKGRPLYRFYYGSVVGAEKIGERRVKFSFSEAENRELPLILGDLPILPMHYWKSRDFEKTTLKPPLGSGRYRIAEFEAGRSIILERVEDYWGKDLAVNRGHGNFDRIRFDYFRDALIIRETLKAGELDFFSENSAKDWSTAYNIPAVQEGLLIKEQFLNKSSGGMQGIFMNSRRSPFDNRLVRQALTFAFDFQWTNQHIYYGLYLQPASYFAPTELAATGLPRGEELEILERYRGRIPEEVFTRVYEPPKTDGSGWPRENLKRAFELLAQAGWIVRDLKLVNKESSQQMSIEIMYQQQSLERSILPFVRNLRRLGINVRMRLVDTSQYINRIRNFDFDMIIFGVAQSLSPGNEQREYWSSAAADRRGSRNIAGIKDPVIDELIELLITAPTRESLVARTQALDRVLLWGHHVIPQLLAPYDRMVYWDKFGRPKITPVLGPSPNYWWFDPIKTADLEQRRATEAPTAELEGEGGPGLIGTLAVFAGLLLAGFFVFRRALHGPQARG